MTRLKTGISQISFKRVLSLISSSKVTLMAAYYDGTKKLNFKKEKVMNIFPILNIVSGLETIIISKDLVLFLILST